MKYLHVQRIKDLEKFNELFAKMIKDTICSHIDTEIIGNLMKVPIKKK